MKKITLYFFLLTTCMLFSQENYIPGNITKIDGTKEVGLIDYQDWKKLPDEIKFKKGNEVDILKPGDLLGFEVENDKFISRDITLDVSEQNLQKLTFRHEAKFKDTRVFLNVLEIGDVSLYEYYDSRPHYFAEKDDDFMELTNRISIDKETNDIKNNRGYIGQLSVFLKECKTVSVKENLEYKRRSLLKLVSKYNNCVTSSNPEEKYTKTDVQLKNKNHFYIIGGINMINAKIDTPRRIITDFEGSSSIAPKLGLAYEFSFTKNRQKWSLYTEMAYSSFKSTENNEVKESTFRLYNPLKLDFKTVDLSLMFRYKFHKDNSNITPFINLGFGRTLFLSQKSTVTENDQFDETRTEDLPVIFNSPFSLSVGTGVIYKDYALEARYYSTGRLLDGTQETSKLSGLRIVFSYKVM